MGYTKRPRAQKLRATGNLGARDSPGFAWREIVQALPGVVKAKKTAQKLAFLGYFSVVEAMGVELFSERKETKN